MTATLTTLSTSFGKLTSWLTPTPPSSPPLLHHRLANDCRDNPDSSAQNYCPNCGTYWPNDEVARYSLDQVEELELLQALGNRAFNRYKAERLILLRDLYDGSPGPCPRSISSIVAPVRQWPRERILKVRARVHRTLDVQQEQVNSDIEAEKRRIICTIHGHGFTALTKWDEYRSNRQPWSGSELRNMEQATDGNALQCGWQLFVDRLDAAEAAQAAQAADAESSQESSQETSHLVESPRSASSAESGRHSARQSSTDEDEDDRVVASLLARSERCWTPRTPRRRSSRESDTSQHW